MGEHMELSSDGRRRRSPFPRQWGPPPDDPEMRARWAASHIKQGEEQRARGLSVPWLGSSRAAGLSIVRARAKLLARRYDPSEMGEEG